jgi:xylulokinase
LGEPWILAIDLGTGGPKTGVISLKGEVLGQSVRAVRTRYQGDGGATQDTADWWRAITADVRKLTTARVAAPRDLVGVGLTGQWGSTVPVDAEGKAAGPCLLWSDTRGGRLARRTVGGLVPLFGYSPGNMVRWMQITGGAPSPGGADPLGHEHYLRKFEPEVYAQAAALMEPVDYLGLRFTGRRAATPASMILSWLTDNRPGAPLGYVPDLVRRARRDPKRLPELIPTGSVLGNILPAVADELGLPQVPVVAGVPDLHTTYIGSGAVAPFQAHVTISTSAWISCEVPFKKTDVIHQMASVPGLRPGTYLVANNHETAGICLQWARDSLFGNDSIQPPSYEDLCAMAGAVPAGSGGVIFTPWLNGERTPVEDRTLRGAFLNLSLNTERAWLVRSVLEGVAFNSRWLLDAVETFAGKRLPTMRILGGGAASDLWCQIHADILERRIERVAQPTFGSLRGAALFAGISLGKLTLEEVPELVQPDQVFEPAASTRSVYRPMYREYRDLYSRLHGMYARLNKVRR